MKSLFLSYNDNTYDLLIKNKITENKIDYDKGEKIIFFNKLEKEPFEYLNPNDTIDIVGTITFTIFGDNSFAAAYMFYYANKEIGHKIIKRLIMYLSKQNVPTVYFKVNMRDIITLSILIKNGFQTRSISKNKEGEDIGEYYFTF